MKIRFTRQEIHEGIYLFSLALLVSCLPLSRYLLSLAQFLLVLNWLVEGRPGEKVTRLRQNPSALVLASLFLLYAAGMLLTSNLGSGWLRVKNALPLLAIPVVMASSPPLSWTNLRRLLLLFVTAVSIAALVCLISYEKTEGTEIRDFRTISLFMSHIRFSLLIVMAILSLLYLAFYRNRTRGLQKFLLLSVALLLIAFLLFLRSLTGFILLLITTIVFLLATARLSRSRLVVYGLPVLAVSLTGILLLLSGSMVTRFFRPDPVDLSQTDRFTASGNLYEQPADLAILENGNYVNLYVCEKELRQEWNRISVLPYDGTDYRQQYLSQTLKRYLTSKGLRKDSSAISQLTPADIRAIESGNTNYLFPKPGLKRRLYETLWEIHVLHKTGFVQNHSLAQRIAFLHSSLRIIRDHPLAGTGIGDVYDTMESVTRDSNVHVEKTWEGKPHNQFAFILMATGIPGFCWFLFCLFYPAIKRRLYRYLLFNLFMTLVLLSMLTLDTLESYDSVVFFSLFYSQFLNLKLDIISSKTGL
jgi:hypothetical protein